MAADKEIRFNLSASSTRLQAEFSKAQATINNFSRTAGGAFSRLSSTILSFNGILAGVGVGLGAGQIIKISDTYKSLEGRLKLVTASSQELARVQKDLFVISQQSRVGYESTLDLYSRIARSTKELNTSATERLKITDTISKSLIVSGASAVEADNAIRQLGQAFAGGMQAQEFNSIIDQTPRLIYAIADGLDLTIAQFREFVKAGKASGKVIYEALGSQSAKINTEFSAMGKTIDQAMTVANNSLGKLISGADKAGSATEQLAEYIISLSGRVDAWAEANDGLIATKMPEYVDKISDSAKKLYNFFEGLPEGSSKTLMLALLGGRILGAPGAVAGGIAGAASIIGDKRRANGFSSKWNTVDAPFDPADFPADNENGRLFGRVIDNERILNLTSSKAAYKSRGASEPDPIIDIYQQRIDMVNALTEAQLKAFATTGTDYTDSWLSKAKEANDVANRAINAPVEILELQQQEIDAALDDFFGSMDKMVVKADKTFGEDMKDAMTGWASSFSKTLTDVLWDSETTFADIATSFGKMITQMVIQKKIMEPLVNGVTSSSIFANIFHDGGIVGQSAAPGRSFPSALFANAPRFHNGLAADEFPAILQKGEAVIPRSMVGAGGGSVQVNVINNANGATAQARERQDGHGNRIIDVIIEQVKGAIAGDISRGDGAIPMAMNRTYGLNRAPGMY